MKQRIFACILACLMLLSSVPTVALVATAEEVSEVSTSAADEPKTAKDLYVQNGLLLNLNFTKASESSDALDPFVLQDTLGNSITLNSADAKITYNNGYLLLYGHSTNSASLQMSAALIAALGETSAYTFEYTAKLYDKDNAASDASHNIRLNYGAKWGIYDYLKDTTNRYFVYSYNGEYAVTQYAEHNINHWSGARFDGENHDHTKLNSFSLTFTMVNSFTDRTQVSGKTFAQATTKVPRKVADETVDASKWGADANIPTDYDPADHNNVAWKDYAGWIEDATDANFVHLLLRQNGNLTLKAERVYAFRYYGGGDLFGAQDGNSVTRLYHFRIYNRALTAEEMAQNHFADLAYACDWDISGYWSLTEDQRKAIHNTFADVTLDEALADPSTAKEILTDAYYRALYVNDGLVLHLNFARATTEDQLYAKTNYTYQQNSETGAAEYSTDGGSTWKSVTSEDHVRADTASTYEKFLLTGKTDFTLGTVYGATINSKTYGVSKFGDGYLELGQYTRFGTMGSAVSDALSAYTIEYTAKAHNPSDGAISTSAYTNYFGSRGSFSENGTTASYQPQWYGLVDRGYKDNPSLYYNTSGEIQSPAALKVTIGSSAKINSYTMVHELADGVTGTFQKPSTSASYTVYKKYDGESYTEARPSPFYDGMKITLWANGKGDANASGTYLYQWNSSYAFGDTSVSNYIYNIRVYNRALSAEESAQNHFADLAYANALDLSDYYALNETQRKGVIAAFVGVAYDEFTKDELQSKLDHAVRYEKNEKQVEYRITLQGIGTVVQLGKPAEGLTLPYSLPGGTKVFAGYKDADGNAVTDADALLAADASFWSQGDIFCSLVEITLIPSYEEITYPFVTDGLLLHVNFAKATANMEFTGSVAAPTTEDQAYAPATVFAPFVLAGDDTKVVGGTTVAFTSGTKAYGVSTFQDGYLSLGAWSRIQVKDALKNKFTADSYTYEFTARVYDKDNTAMANSSRADMYGLRLSISEKYGEVNIGAQAASGLYGADGTATFDAMQLDVDTTKINSYTLTGTLKTDPSNLGKLSGYTTEDANASSNTVPTVTIGLIANGDGATQVTSVARFKWVTMQILGDSNASTHVYNFRFYNRALTADESAQNHFADIAYKYNFSASLMALYNALPAEEVEGTDVFTKADVHAHYAGSSLDAFANDAAAQKDYMDWMQTNGVSLGTDVLAENVLSFAGFATRVAGYPGLRSIFKVDQTQVAAWEEEGYTVSYGAILAVVGSLDANVQNEFAFSKLTKDASATGMKVMTVYETGKTEAKYLEPKVEDYENKDPENGALLYQRFACTITFKNESAQIKENFESELAFRGFVTLTKDGESTTYYTNTSSQTFGVSEDAPGIHMSEVAEYFHDYYTKEETLNEKAASFLKEKILDVVTPPAETTPEESDPAETDPEETTQE